MTIWSGRWWTCSSRGNLWLHFLSIRFVCLLFFFHVCLLIFNFCVKWNILSISHHQSSKCRSVFTSAQKLEGYKRLDRQLAQFNDYNFVFTSYAKNHQQNQQSWGLRMKKRRKKKVGRRLGFHSHGQLHPPVESLSSSLSSSTSLHLLCCHRRSELCSAGGVASPSLTSSLSCLHCCTRDLDLPHESSVLCVDILAHSCCDLEVHVEELNMLRSRQSTHAQRNGPFLQVSPLIPHRQGFRPH